MSGNTTIVMYHRAKIADSARASAPSRRHGGRAIARGEQQRTSACARRGAHRQVQVVGRTEHHIAHTPEQPTPLNPVPAVPSTPNDYIVLHAPTGHVIIADTTRPLLTNIERHHLRPPARPTAGAHDDIRCPTPVRHRRPRSMYMRRPCNERNRCTRHATYQPSVVMYAPTRLTSTAQRCTRDARRDI